MNNTRRKEISKLLEEIEQSTRLLRELGEEEQRGFDNLPEGIQESENGQKMEETVEEINRICDEFDGLREEFSDATD